MLLSRTAGMGAYPGDSYFDPGRPSWLPFWIDTPTESALKYGLYPGVTQAQVTGAAYPAPPAPAPPAAPGSADQVWTPDLAIAQADAITKQQNLDFFSNLAPTLAPSNSGIGAMWLYVAIGVGVLALVLLMRGR